MKRLKKLWNEHKVAICVIGGGVLVGSIGIAWLIKHNIVGVVKCCPIESGGPTNLKRVKEILDANKDNLSKFAIFREGPNPAEYMVVVLDGTDLVLP